MNDARLELLVLNERTVAKIADAAEASERSVWKRLAGGRVRGLVQGRIDRAIAAARADALARGLATGRAAAAEPKPAA